MSASTMGVSVYNSTVLLLLPILHYLPEFLVCCDPIILSSYIIGIIRVKLLYILGLLLQTVIL